MKDNIFIKDIIKKQRILIYGAGQVGCAFLRRVGIVSCDVKNLTVWDMRFAEIHELYGWKVECPDFESAKNFDVAIIALSSKENQTAIDEIKNKLTDNGLKDVYLSSRVNFAIEQININDFENKGYADCEYQSDVDFSDHKPRIKALAYYLPQFHEMPENNEWWGEGFTEWTNTRKAKPRFKGHYQPREPHGDFGYYDLSDVSVIRKQAELAKRHGIYGWCIYYYWFSGKTLLTKPIDLLLENRDIDIKFCLNWCNVDWTKSWVGNSSEILMKNDFTLDDARKLAVDLKRYVDDERYVRLNGKPLFIILSSETVPNIKSFIDTFRSEAQKIGIGELEIVDTVEWSYKNSHNNNYENKRIFDGFKTFAPVVLIPEAYDLTDDHFVIRGKAGDYKHINDKYFDLTRNMFGNAYYTCMTGWDNSPRFESNFRVYDMNYSLKEFYESTARVIDESLRTGKEFIFPFAWNEWAEGAYLEPDKRFGYAVINTLSKALCGLPFSAGN